MTAILLILLLWAASKWLLYRLSFMAILLYFAECGIELPNTKQIQEYRIKIIQKSLGFKGR